MPLKLIKMKVNVKEIAIWMMIVLMVSACASDPDSSGYEYMPDMYRSAAIEPYVDYGQIREKINPELTSKLSAMVPPFGTIPYYGTDADEVALMLPFSILPNVVFKQTHDLRNFDFSTEDTYAQAANFKTNPYTLTPENAESVFAKAKTLFKDNCSQCHGEKGDGNGPMSTNGLFTGVPDYADKTELSDGQMFYSIYYGKGAMGAHASILNKKEIWSLVHYIRRFQDPEYGKYSLTTHDTDINTNIEE